MWYPGVAAIKLTATKRNNVTSLKIINTSTKNQMIAKFLSGWLACGLTVQIGLIFWPIGNYATAVYLLFYVPLLFLLIFDFRSLINIVISSDRILTFSLLALLFWVTISSLWADSKPTNLELFQQTLKYNLLILLYIVGIAYLAKQRPKFLWMSLVSSVVLIAVLALASIYHMYFIINHPSTVRISLFGYGQFIISANPVTTGIYFGSISIIIIALFFTRVVKQFASAPILLLAALLPCLAITFLTGTRSALIALPLTMITFLFIVRSWKLGVMLSFIICCAAIISFFAEATYFNNLLMRGGLGGWRPQIWSSAILLAQENIWIGSGMWHDTSMVVSRDGVVRTMPHSHNHYLQILVWNGSLGLGLYVLLLAKAIYQCLIKRRKPLMLLSLLSLLYFLFAQFFDVFTVFTRPSYYWPCVWLPIGIAIGHSNNNRSPTELPS